MHLLQELPVQIHVLKHELEVRATKRLDKYVSTKNCSDTFTKMIGHKTLYQYILV